MHGFCRGIKLDIEIKHDVPFAFVALPSLDYEPTVRDVIGCAQLPANELSATVWSYVRLERKELGPFYIPNQLFVEGTFSHEKRSRGLRPLPLLTLPSAASIDTHFNRIKCSNVSLTTGFTPYGLLQRTLFSILPCGVATLELVVPFGIEPK